MDEAVHSTHVCIRDAISLLFCYCRTMKTLQSSKVIKIPSQGEYAYRMYARPLSEVPFLFHGTTRICANRDTYLVPSPPCPPPPTHTALNNSLSLPRIHCFICFALCSDCCLERPSHQGDGSKGHTGKGLWPLLSGDGAAGQEHHQNTSVVCWEEAGGRSEHHCQSH